ncbi:hypothetical protein F1880_005953 [Penicillium rolfsii]|nr:hypothetical protein F1880_005953 [Penicillium rolfsii]
MCDASRGQSSDSECVVTTSEQLISQLGLWYPAQLKTTCRPKPFQQSSPRHLEMPKGSDDGSGEAVKSKPPEDMHIHGLAQSQTEKLSSPVGHNWRVAAWQDFNRAGCPSWARSKNSSQVAGSIALKDLRCEDGGDIGFITTRRFTRVSQA